jgi:hypothetical protein
MAITGNQQKTVVTFSQRKAAVNNSIFTLQSREEIKKRR